jgi:perosamine synthetase
MLPRSSRTTRAIGTCRLSARLNMAPSEPISFARPFFGPEEGEAVIAVLKSGWIVGGPKLQELEQRFAELCDTGYAVGVSSWTTGAFLILHAWNIGSGDEVIVPSLTFIASVNIIRHVGATPIFVDVEAGTFNLDPADVARKITPRTRAILPVDQLGLPCDMAKITALVRGRGIRVLEDAACAFASRADGRPVGALADAAAFSLHARKIVTTGEGGMIVTSDGDLAARLRRLRHQGMSLSDRERNGMPPTTFETYPEIGYNFRITDIQAAIGLRQLDRLDEILARRRAVAARYSQALANHPHLAAPHTPQGLEPNWQTYQVTLRDSSPISRDTLMDRLFARGIPTRRGVMASHLESPYRDSGLHLPVTERLAATTFQLPMHPGLTAAQIDRIVDTLLRLAA